MCKFWVYTCMNLIFKACIVEDLRIALKKWSLKYKGIQCIMMGYIEQFWIKLHVVKNVLLDNNENEMNQIHRTESI